MEVRKNDHREPYAKPKLAKHDNLKDNNNLRVSELAVHVVVPPPA